MQITTSRHQDNSNHLFYAFSFQHVDTTSEEGILAETFLDACRNIVPMFGKYFVTTIKLIKRHEKKKVGMWLKINYLLFWVSQRKLQILLSQGIVCWELSNIFQPLFSPWPGTLILLAHLTTSEIPFTYPPPPPHPQIPSFVIFFFKLNEWDAHVLKCS